MDTATLEVTAGHVVIVPRSACADTQEESKMMR